jgi:hypothetical protein
MTAGKQGQTVRKIQPAVCGHEKTPRIEGFKVSTITGFETESWHLNIRVKTDKKRAFTDI